MFSMPFGALQAMNKSHNNHSLLHRSHITLWEKQLNNLYIKLND